jgi:hypothetical protein
MLPDDRSSRVPPALSGALFDRLVGPVSHSLWEVRLGRFPFSRSWVVRSIRRAGREYCDDGLGGLVCRCIFHIQLLDIRFFSHPLRRSLNSTEDFFHVVTDLICMTFSTIIDISSAYRRIAVDPRFFPISASLGEVNTICSLSCLWG